MKPNNPQRSSLEERKIYDDAQQQFKREQLQKRNKQMSRRKSQSQMKSIFNEEEKMDFQKHYEMQKKQCENLKLENQKLRIQLQSRNELYEQMLKKAEQKKDQTVRDKDKTINELTDQNKRLHKINANNSFVLQNTIKEKNEEIQIYQRELYELKDQNRINQNRINEVNQKLSKLQSTVGMKNQQIDELKNLLANAESKIQELKNQLADAESENRHQFKIKEQQEARYQEKLMSINQQKNATHKKLQQLQDQRQMMLHENQEKKSQIEKLNQTLKQTSNDVFESTEKDSKQVKYSYLVMNEKLRQLMVIDSLVLKDGKEIHTLCNMFQHKKPKGFKLIFRASDYGDDDFNNKSKYCGVAHTVLLVKTNKGKVIGGYTPLKWKIVKGWFWPDNSRTQKQLDTSGESFIFSVTNNHKLTLQSPAENPAIFHDNIKGPVFRGGISISHKANQDNNSWSLMYDPLPYAHDEYKGRKDKESCLKFAGSEDGSFKAQEWEVHEVIFSTQ